MAYQITVWTKDITKIAFVIRRFEQCNIAGEPVQWHLRHRWTKKTSREPCLQFAIFRDDCHIERRHDRGYENVAVLVEDVEDTL